MTDILRAIFRSGIAFLLLVMLTYFVGKQINAHKNYLNFALSITLGSLIANMGFDINIKFLPIFCSFVAIGLIYFGLSILAFKNQRFQEWFSGKPTVIITEGQLIHENLRKINYSIDTLGQQLRESGIFNREEVEFAQLEVSGNLSVIKKTPYKATVKKDLRLPVELIVAGRILHTNLTEKYTLEWLTDECLKRDILLAKVAYGIVSSDGHLIIDLNKGI